MMWTELLIAISLIFVIEGLVLAAFPEVLKRGLQEVLQLPPHVLRFTGIASMLFGLVLLLVFR